MRAPWACCCSPAVYVVARLGYHGRSCPLHGIHRHAHLCHSLIHSSIHPNSSQHRHWHAGSLTGRRVHGRAGGGSCYSWTCYLACAPISPASPVSMSRARRLAASLPQSAALSLSPSPMPTEGPFPSPSPIADANNPFAAAAAAAAAAASSSPIHLPERPSCLRDTLHARHSFVCCCFHAASLKPPLRVCICPLRLLVASPRPHTDPPVRQTHCFAADQPSALFSPFTRLCLPSASIDWIPCLVCSKSGLSTLLPSLPAGNIQNIRNIQNNNTCSANTSASPPPPSPPPPPPRRLHHWPWPSSFGHVVATLWTVLPTPPSHREFIRATFTKPNRLPSRGFLRPTSLSHTTNSFPQDLTPDPGAERV